MKRIICVLMIALCLSGCGEANTIGSCEEGYNSTDMGRVDEKDSINTEGSVNTEDESDGELTLMQKVLFNQAEFYGNIDPYENKYGWHMVEEIEGYGSTDRKFGVIDFDGDGRCEVYIYYMDALIFHEQDGVIYGYCMPYRGLLRVCTNGTFEGTKGACTGSRTLNVVFNKSEMQYDYISFEGSYDTNTVIYTKGTSIRNEKEWYAKNEVEITEAEYQALMSRYPQGEDNPEYLLTMENILKYVK